jgi:hypothetical protein
MVNGEPRRQTTVWQVLPDEILAADENERAFTVLLGILQGGGHNDAWPVIASHGVERNCYRLGHAGRPPDIEGFSV